MKPRTTALLCASLLCATAGVHPAAAQKAPTVGEFEQAVTKYLDKIRNSGIAQQRVYFESVQEGRATAGTFPFRATVTIWQYFAGVRGLNFGETCLGKWVNEDFTLTRNEQFGGWDAHTPLIPTGAQHPCTKNPADGASAYPPASMHGHEAGAAGAAPPPSAPAPAAPAAATGSGGIALGAYECWANGQARLLMNFTALAGGKYTDSENKTGAYRVDPTSQRITFKGGMLDGVLPAGFYAVYHLSQGVPAVSFRNAQGNEVSYCERH
jgi:hypothetical protein